MTKVLFNFPQVMELVKKYKKMHISDDMNDYEMGVIDGIDVLLYLYERCEK